MKKLLLYLLGLSLFVVACKKNDPQPEPEPPAPAPPTTNIPTPPTRTPWVAGTFKIVAYMPSYRDPATVDDSKYKMITHLLFAFLNVNPTGDGSVNPLTTTENARFNTVKAKALANNVKFGISVMGAEAIFATIAASPTARTNFVNNVVNFAKVNGLDGIDIDWEYPRTVGGNPNPDFTALMAQLSVALHSENKFLSAAITPAVYASTNKDAISQDVYQYVDFFNIMQYDGGVNYDTADPLNHATYKMSVNSLNTWIDTKKMPKEKAVVGIPLYGKPASGSAKGYRDIEASGANVYLNVATVGSVDYGYNGIELIWKKAQLAKERANGIMFWEFSFDSNSSKSLIRAANDQLGRNYN
ncbi:glycosyl hydrolase family 18 protein [Pedobacter helvus]|uniref:chitinase n=1 Tax=Pedobacter helvus TaxID=2563444 RepID=A0ABW9JGI7_9SPHI|nr:glycosyl hydrolase family 18 protein [Pedobacter ureilyticus]